MVDMLQTRRPSMYPGINSDRSNISMYPGAHTGIDFRAEMDDILGQYGHWVLVRHFDTSQHSEYWDYELREAVGGPAWEWTDYVVRARKVIQRSGGVLSALEMPAVPGVISVPYVTYYLKWNVVGAIPLTQYDDIYEFTWNSNNIPQPDEAVKVCTSKYNILEVVDLLGDSGRREYYLCVCRTDVVG